MQKRIIVFAGISGAMGVTLGAMAAHFLKSRLEEGLITQNDIQAFETASRYQIYHSIALLCIALLYDKLHDKLIKKAAYCFMLGIVLFSGSIYLLSTSALIGLRTTNWLGPVTPLGGIFLITGWILLALSAKGYGIKKQEH